MSFFINKGNQVSNSKNSIQRGKKRKHESEHEEVTSSEDEDMEYYDDANSNSSDNENETAQEKKVRLAKLYLEEIEKEERIRLEKDEVDQTVISKRLKEDYLKETGKLRINLADKYKSVLSKEIRTLKCKKQRSCLTCMCLSSDNQVLFCGSKDGVVIKYCLKTFKTIGVIPFVRSIKEQTTGHTSEILSLAISTDSMFLAVGDKLGNVNIWDPCSLKHVKNLMGHKNSILGLTFKKESHTMFSCSKDKSVKVWDLDEMAYVETLFGHQGPVMSIDSLNKDRVVSSGCHDLRLWKITEETQLIYNGHTGNIDHVKFINQENFLTAGDDGQICVWSIMRKKPLCSIQAAHGKDPSNSQPRWITAITALTNTDLVASGSMDGFVRLWKLSDSFKRATEIMKINVKGVVNVLEFTADREKLLVCVSQEYKLGRWITVKSVKNKILVIPFKL
ncbi:U3 small nucleolar RNA-interacting protein 2 [Euwallacea fornicatus]|uniref:U3 small nucleolar RNA-interacting protein 2 n=1 Tax=Euwallacea fornicatus TaxID=995702 RepID=UPI00338DFB95